MDRFVDKLCTILPLGWNAARIPHGMLHAFLVVCCTALKGETHVLNGVRRYRQGTIPFLLLFLIIKPFYNLKG